MREADFYQKIKSGEVICQLCARQCVIQPGQTGFCRARKNLDGCLFSLIYGLPAVQNVDPVEKKPLFSFFPGTFTYSVGTYGCNFTCANCHNYDLSQAEDLEDKISLLPEIKPAELVSEALANNCRSLAYTYNEPTICGEYYLAVARLARANGLKNIWVSNGYLSPIFLEALLPWLDAANIDLKSIDDYFYRENCGASLPPILENLKKIKQYGIHLEISTLIIPGLTDGVEMLAALADFIVNELGDDTPWHISKFSAPISWHLKNRPSADETAIYKAFDIGKQKGLKFVYAGNMPGDQRENTYCPKCGELVIRRFGWDNITRFDHHGICPKCNMILDIIG